jgi:hypothetical protein
MKRQLKRPPVRRNKIGVKSTKNGDFVLLTPKLYPESTESTVSVLSDRIILLRKGKLCSG